jgi:ABC-type branched-subunit amino acid transport system substrate-binding protein
MDQADTIIAVFPNHEDADKAVQALAAAGIGVKNISVVGKGYHTEEKVMGFYNMGDRMQMWA